MQLLMFYISSHQQSILFYCLFKKKLSLAFFFSFEIERERERERTELANKSSIDSMLYLSPII